MSDSYLLDPLRSITGKSGFYAKKVNIVANDINHNNNNKKKNLNINKVIAKPIIDKYHIKLDSVSRAFKKYVTTFNLEREFEVIHFERFIEYYNNLRSQHDIRR